MSETTENPTESAEAPAAANASGSSAIASQASIHAMVVEIVRELVSVPDAVRIEERDHEEDGDRFRLYELHVDNSDLGKVIGKNGRTARALRAMVNAMAAKLRVQAELEIVEPDRPAGEETSDEDRRADARNNNSDEGGDEGDDEGSEGDEGSEEDDGEAGAPDA